MGCKQLMFENKSKRDTVFFCLRKAGFKVSRFTIRDQYLWDGGVENLGLPMRARKNFRIVNAYIINVLYKASQIEELAKIISEL